MMGLAIESSNYALLAALAIMVQRIFCWRIKNHLSVDVQAITWAWIWCFSGVGIRAAWFATSRHTALPGETWNQVMFEVRYLVIMITAAMMIWGVTEFMRLIDGFSRWVQVQLASVSIFAGALMGYY